MRSTATLLCITLSVVLVGMVSAAEETAPTSQDSTPVGTPLSATNRDPAEPGPFSRFNVACPDLGVPAANLLFELQEPQYVTLQIYDESGQLVRGLLDEERPAGFQTIAWNGRDRTGKDLGAGQYYALLGVAGKYEVQTMSLQRTNSR